MIRILTLSLLLTSPGFAQKKLDFAHEVLPILRARCASCHTGDKHKGGLSMNDRATLLKSDVVVPGKSEKSKLFSRITSKNPQKRMPPKGKPLDAKQIATLKRWIDEGVPWEAGFSFAQKYNAPMKLVRAKLPPANGGRAHPIDRFVDAYQSKLKIKPSAPLDDASFLRRLHLDLVGLIPTPEQLKVKDRAKAIEDVLGNRQAYTEHWMTFWNDHLRNDYRGTGYIDGGRRQITGWLYQSLMENKPYDQFVRDLITPTTGAEGFIKGIKWRGRVNASQIQELQFARSVGQVFLGINLKCASCHDSFIDNLKLTDAYGLAAVVSNRPLEIHRCDKPTGKMAKASFLYSELGQIDASKPRSDRLKQLADLMTKKENGRFARTIVNRIWARLFGRGIVHPVDMMDNRPWSPELLDYLALYLIDNGYDLKKLMSHIVNSKTYQSQSVQPSKEGESYVFRGPIAKRMTAEQFLDAIWRITDTAPGRVVARVGNRGKEPVRASLVVSDPLMRSLGRPNREQIVTSRPAELSTLQALDLSNGEILANLLDRGAANLLRKNPKWTPAQMIDWLYRRALCRAPTSNEAKISQKILTEKMTPQSLSDLLWVLFMLPEMQMNR